MRQQTTGNSTLNYIHMSFDNISMYIISMLSTNGGFKKFTSSKDDFHDLNFV